jgi:hypothetical protein
LESVFLQNGLGSFPDISYFTDLRQIRDAEKIQKTVLKPCWEKSKYAVVISNSNPINSG